MEFRKGGMSGNRVIIFFTDFVFSCDEVFFVSVFQSQVEKQRFGESYWNCDRVIEQKGACSAFLGFKL